MRPLETLTLIEIQKLFKRYFGADLPRSSIYYHIKKSGFPPNIGFGKPRRWSKSKVMAWFNKHKG